MANLHLFWDGASAPTGWTIVSDSGGAFYQKMIRGNSAYGGTGGTTTHTHTTSIATNSGPDTFVNLIYINANTFAHPAHQHLIGSIASDSKSNLPNYRTLKVIKCNSTGTPLTIPAGAVVIFNSLAMTGYTRYSVQDNLHIYCGGTAGTVAGSNTHSHLVSGTTANNTSYIVHRGGSDVSSIVYSHYHTYSKTTDNPNNEPPYVTAYMGKMDLDGSPIADMIGMWNGTPPPDWIVLSNVGGVFYQKWVKPANSYNSTGGSLTHSHANVSNTTDVSSSPSSVGLGGGALSTTAYAHRHTMVIALQANVSHIAPYIDVIFAKYVPPGSLSISSTPTGAEIYLALGTPTDQLTTTSPSGTTISNLTPGTYNIKLTLAGYQDWTGTAIVTSYTTTPVSATFTGSIYITSTPSGAEIYLAVSPGTPVDQSSQTPRTITNLTAASPGATAIRNYKLTLSGYADTAGSFTATAGSTISIPVTFPGSYSISTGITYGGFSYGSVAIGGRVGIVICGTPKANLVVMNQLLKIGYTHEEISKLINLIG